MTGKTEPRPAAARKNAACGGAGGVISPPPIPGYPGKWGEG